MAKGKIVNTTIITGRYRPENRLKQGLWDARNGAAKKVRDRMGRPLYVPLEQWKKT